MDYQDLVNEVCSLGAHRAAVVPVSSLSFDPIFRSMCESNACGNFGKCWMCPPDVKDIHVLIQDAVSYDNVLVYQTVGQLEDSFDFEGRMEAAQKHNLLARKLSSLFAALPYSRKLHLGAGGCHVCQVCAKCTNEPCRYPDQAMPSLEVYGINVSELAASAGMHYINGKDTVTYFGALLFTQA